MKSVDGIRGLKRIFDFVAACLGLALFSPFMLVIAFLIKATSPGPVFFRQERVGWKEKVFRAYKFRTMVEHAEEMGSSVTTRNDPRITPIGIILRKTKFDELPQLINVFKGDMSLVGPRPDVSEIVCNYTHEMRRIFQIRPGITSTATLYLTDEESILAEVKDPDSFYQDVLVPLKVKLAMEHVDRNSFTFDLKILCKTIWMLTLGRRIEDPQITQITQMKDHRTYKVRRLRRKEMI